MSHKAGTQTIARKLQPKHIQIHVHIYKDLCKHVIIANYNQLKYFESSPNNPKLQTATRAHIETGANIPKLQTTRAHMWRLVQTCHSCKLQHVHIYSE